ncbi:MULTISPECIES: FUSC family protein [Terrisporobacter]|uniref:Integral membrane bound transporter domain-containing protein n=2 Tax=Terrisporobacter TaxID=1505652 RepID=A0A0B3WQH7_9FIRM|nr:MULTISPECIES: FUSC family protein [Terrisporobacter]KHS56730.1 hypothetical protein QX51_12175 [Terrisporobacter othiniensis]MCC3669619.1 FUSC family protein [Terrisporobacter mayombei]MCR1821841.1 FUSC family protein [Terrisporobacter muris]MDU6985331.1 FUSC family protein [Terrisporobacter othiniensis]MDY3374244.1 FUSC family protein [Terrisporobacter othiniensis]
MDKKLIVSKTVTFIAIIAFIVVFKLMFGEKNTLIGVTTVTATLMFLERDLSLSPVRNTIKLILINLLIGISSYLVISNMYLGIIVNFFTLFLISYNFCYNLRNPLYLPFTLQYLFLLANPVDNQELLLRIFSLVFGAIVIMLAQILVNKNRLAKSGNKLLENVCDSIVNKIEYKEQYDLVDDGVEKVNQSIDAFRTMVYDKREYNYYLTEEGRLKLNLSVALENIHSMIHDTNLGSIDNDILKTLELLIKEVKLLLNNSKDNIGGHDVTLYMQKLFKICEEKDIDDLLNLQLLDSMLLLSDTIKSLRALDEKQYNIVDRSHEISELFSDSGIKSFFMDKKSIRFCYAMRVAISITIATFIMQYFNLSEGRWILFTLLSLITPLYEASKSKTKDRVFATIIGSIIIFILFSIFKDPTLRMLIILATGYLNGYANQYRYSTIFVTVSAIGSAALLGDVGILTINRIFFVFVGIVMAILANKYIFPYKVKDSMIQLKNMYHETIINMLKEVKNLVEGNKQPTTMKNLIVLTSLIDAKARGDEKIANSPSYSKIISERRSLVANIYELYIWILRGEIKSQSQKEILNDLKDLINYSNEDISSKVAKIEYGITVAKDINTKIILSSIIVILKELCHLGELNKSI